MRKETNEEVFTEIPMFSHWTWAETLLALLVVGLAEIGFRTMLYVSLTVFGLFQ